MKAWCVAVAWTLALAAAPVWSRGAEPPPPEAQITGRIEVVPHQHCFTVRFYLNNPTPTDVAVVYGRGRAGLTNVPSFGLRYARSGTMTIQPPIYRHPPHRALRPDTRTVPAKGEILYGEFTMGWPPGIFERYREGKLRAHFSFHGGPDDARREYRIETPEAPLTMPATVPPAKRR
jgi:hypothetical protein